MLPWTTFFFLLLTTFMSRVADASASTRPRRIPISSYNRNSNFPLIKRPFDEATFNKTNELSEKINRVLEPYKKNNIATIHGLKFFQEPMKLDDMAFSSQYDPYESINFTNSLGHGLSNFTVMVSNVGVPTDDVTQVHIHVYVTMPRLEVTGNFTLVPASGDPQGASLPKSGDFNFTAVELLATGNVKISEVEHGYRTTMTPYLPIAHDDMYLNLENVSFENDFLNHEIFENVDPLLREQVKLFFSFFADGVLEGVRVLDQNAGVQTGPTATELARWGRHLQMSNTSDQNASSETSTSGFPTSEYSASENPTTVPPTAGVQTGPTAKDLIKWGRHLQMSNISDQNTSSESPISGPPTSESPTSGFSTTGVQNGPTAKDLIKWGRHLQMSNISDQNPLSESSTSGSPTSEYSASESPTTGPPTTGVQTGPTSDVLANRGRHLQMNNIPDQNTTSESPTSGTPTTGVQTGPTSDILANRGRHIQMNNIPDQNTTSESSTLEATTSGSPATGVQYGPTSDVLVNRGRHLQMNNIPDQNTTLESPTSGTPTTGVQTGPTASKLAKWGRHLQMSNISDQNPLSESSTSGSPTSEYSASESPTSGSPTTGVQTGPTSDFLGDRGRHLQMNNIPDQNTTSESPTSGSPTTGVQTGPTSDFLGNRGRHLQMNNIPDQNTTSESPTPGTMTTGVQTGPTSDFLGNRGRHLQMNNIPDQNTTSESLTVRAFSSSSSLQRSVPKSSYSPTPNTSETIENIKVDELLEKIKKALEPYNRTRTRFVTIPGPSFFQDPMSLEDLTLSIRYGYETANFTDLWVYGMAKFSVNIFSVGYYVNRMPVHIYMYLKSDRLEVLGNFTLAQDTSDDLKSGAFNFTVFDATPRGVLKISQDEYGYFRTVELSDSVRHGETLLDLDDLVVGPNNMFLKYELLREFQTQYIEQARLFFLHFGDKLINQLEAMDGEPSDTKVV